MAAIHRSRFIIPRPRRHALAAAAGLAVLNAAWAQSTVEQITVTGHAVAPPASVAGFGDVPLARTPLQATTASLATLQDLGLDSLGGITRLDASIGDAYNAPGYYAGLRVRGYALDNRFNFRRDGLPVNAESALPLADLERVEVLKGTSGAQAGTSAPGGLVNLVVKRPRGGDSTQLLLGVSDAGSTQFSADVDRRLDDTFSLRLNLDAEHLHPLQYDAQGQRWLLAAAGEARLAPGRLLEAEVEWSHQSQPSIPGFSLLGSTLPSAHDIDPRINLNDQPWSQPVVFDNTTASLRYTQALGAGWKLVAHAMTQQLRTDDRLAFPYGCSAENNYSSYCSNGTFDLYDFRSDGEKRQTDAAQLRIEGRFDTAGWHHDASAGLLYSRYQQRENPEAYNLAGIGSIDGHTMVPAAPVPLDTNTNRSGRSVEAQLMDHVSRGDWGLWLGLRNTQLRRDSVQTDGSQPTSYPQAFTTPWLAGSWQASAADMLYGSWGQSVESTVAPNLPAYGTQAGQPLPAQVSRQTEIGYKHDGGALGWSLAAFDIRRPYVDDTGSQVRIDGTDRHRGIEAGADLREGPWTLRGSAMWLQARREGSADPSSDGRTPEDVAQHVLRGQLGYQVDSVPGLSLTGSLNYEGPRYVLPDDSLAIGGWSTIGLAARYAWRHAGRDWLLRAGVDNLLDRRAWQESPYQYGHAYLYPLQPRSLRASLQVSL